MKVPLLDLRPQMAPLEEEIKAAVGEVIASTQYILGPKVEAFEAELSEYLGGAHVVGVSSGTDALLVSLMALGIGHGDLVLTTPYTFFATAGVIVRVGARPVFIDIDPETFNLCPEALRRWRGDHPDKLHQVKAVMPVHLYGQCADMAPILGVAAQHGWTVVEDAAQAIGAHYPVDGTRKPAATLGELGCLSFFPSKNLGCIGDAGAVATRDEEVAARLRQFRMHGENPRYHHACIGGNFRIDPIQCAALSVKLPHLDGWNAARREHARYYDGAFADTAITTPKIAYTREDHVYNQYVIMTPGRREELRAHLLANGVGHNVYYPLSLHQQECFKDLGYRAGDFPASEDAAARSLALPVYPELTEEMQAYVVEQVLAFYA